MNHLADFFPLPEGEEQFPLEFIESRGALKLSQNESRILVGLVDEHNEKLKAELAYFFPEPLEFLLIDQQELAEFLSRQYSQVQSQSDQVADEKLLLDKLANDAPVVNLVNNILLEGIRLGCSDIHFEALPRQVRVRYRVDGVLRTGRTLPRNIFPSLSSRIKVMANLNIIERRQPQDGRLSVNAGGRDVEFRVSIVPLTDGESIVLRLFQRQGEVQSLENLGFSSDYLEPLRSCSKSSNGLILITGPTGSGKTTTLNALIRELSTEDKKVITIEDPVENILDGVNQIQTNEAIGLSFDTILRRLLRQDPNILMVGEIRDRKTAELSLRSALTGHLVLSTLHTNDALGAIPRLTNMGAEPYLLGAVLRAVAAQRLVRKICPACRKPATPTPSQKAWLSSRLGKALPPLFKGEGCPECAQSGYKGRTVIAEIFQIDDAVEEMIVQGGKRREMEEYFRKKKAIFLLDDTLRKLSDGITTIDEVERAVLSR
ncbi:MAG: type II/IV secretion system protein [Spirochaetales bacterium]|nr:type II/IV secretion system protein [Spirochaetales bacterium]